MSSRALLATVSVALLAACAFAEPGHSQTIPQDDFEAGLRSAPASSPPAVAGRGGGRSGGRGAGPGGRGARSGPVSAPPPVAAAGVIPAGFRSLRQLDQNSEAAIRAAVRDGQLDPFAIMEQIAGPLPLPPGALPLRCRNQHDELVFSLGVPASPAYMSALAAARAQPAGQANGAMENGRIVASPAMRFAMDRSELADSPTTRTAKRRAEAHLLASGFVRSTGDAGGRELYRPGMAWRGRTPITIVFEDDALQMGDLCLRRGIEVPYGPVMIVSYD